MKTNAEKSNVKAWLEVSLAGRRGKSHAKLWAKLYESMAVPRRRRAEVNLNKISKLSRDGEHVIVPGKVLGIGSVGHKVSITALEYSAKAREALDAKGCRVLGIREAYDALSKDGKVSVRIIK